MLNPLAPHGTCPLKRFVLTPARKSLVFWLLATEKTPLARGQWCANSSSKGCGVDGNQIVWGILNQLSCAVALRPNAFFELHPVAWRRPSEAVTFRLRHVCIQKILHYSICVLWRNWPESFDLRPFERAGVNDLCAAAIGLANGERLRGFQGALFYAASTCPKMNSGARSVPK